MQCSDFSCFLSCLCVAAALSDPLSGEGQQHWGVSRLSALSELEGET